MPEVSLWWSLPFALLLASIALMPFIHRHWWEKNYPWFAFGLGAIGAFYYFVVVGHPAKWLESMGDYVSFIILLFSLYMVSGGISIRVARRATPAANSVFLLIGALLSNLLGTTGAAMLLIRPFMRMNRGHLRPYHVIFFIFIVANVGGSLTPIGDPPLFLGYLKGIPFWWVAEHMFSLWAVTVGLLLAVFFVIDTIDHRGGKGRAHPEDGGPQVHILGMHNFLFIGLILLAVFQRGVVELIEHIVHDGASVGDILHFAWCREVLMLAAALLSRRFTGRTIYEHNDFGYGPIREVAILFVGIFSTMAPTLQWLEHNAEKLHLNRPGQFYFATGSLSAMLDNAPTYLSFLKARMGELSADEVNEARTVLAGMAAGKTLDVPAEVANPDVRAAVRQYAADFPEDILGDTVAADRVKVSFLVGCPQWNLFIVAISAGAVFFGACTYIGNGPNFMVKSIAESSGVKMPTFVGYILRFTLPILLPILVLVWVLFFMGQ